MKPLITDQDKYELGTLIFKRSFTGIILILLFCSLDGQGVAKQSNSQTGNFRAAVVKSDITPDNPQYLIGYQERKSAGIHDHIFHRIIALDDGTAQFFIVSTDICLISPVEYDRMAERLKKQLNIDPVNFWWATTHTHSAPEVGTPGLYKIYMGERNQHQLDETYTAMVEQKLIDGISEARLKLAPARLGAGWGFSQANINRRAVDVDGKASLGLNPDGEVDRRIGILRIEKENGSLMALIANYPLHGTVMSGENLLISGDAPGVVSEYVEEKTGTPLIFINGAAGNLAPIYSVYPNPGAGHLGQFRVLLGDRIVEANRSIISSTGKVTLKPGALIVETPRKQGMPWPSDCNSFTRTALPGINMVKLPVRFLRINDDIAIWTAPVELFCEISNRVRENSPFNYTFYFGYTNGWFGYLVAASQYKYEGYEPRVSPFTPQADRDLTEAVTVYLKGELKSGRE
jgi:neutral ceramidase